MKLRTRLFLSTSAPLAVLGALILVAYGGFLNVIEPDLLARVKQKAATSAAVLGGELDVALGAQDPQMVADIVAPELEDDDLAYLEVRDAGGATVFIRGVRGHDVTGDPSRTAHAFDGEVDAWSPIELEGVRLGEVRLRYSTARVDRMEHWAHRFALVILVAWLGALAYALRFSRQFVAPIKDMMDFSGEVAHGVFDRQLAKPAPGELGELTHYLNAMARDLDSREQERKRSAERVESMQNELLSVSRMAGMAEVATGVLHNVGNVLNSLNTSVSVMSTKLKASKVSALARSIELYRDYPGGLGAFLSTDKGKLLPQYLDKVSTHLASENADVLGELDSVTRNVQHIASIVATQQSYTRAGAVHEVTDLSALIDDALGMVEGSFARHGVAVVKEYEALPTVITDRHKVLQIIVNLVSNARHALNERTADDKRLRVHVRPCPRGVAITIDDNGIGIGAENLARIFQHGFTTKRQGHGFGLHSAANAASELGGILTVASDGRDRGAAFTLELPTEPPARSRHDLAN